MRRRFALGARDVCLVGEVRSAPLRHCRDPQICGHTTTVMNGMSMPSASLYRARGPCSWFDWLYEHLKLRKTDGSDGAAIGQLLC